MSVVRIPPTLRAETAGEREVEAGGHTVRELLDDLTSRFPALRGQLLEDDELAPSCAEGGVLGVLPGVIGSLQAAEALKLALGIGEPLVGRLLMFDALDTAFREVKLRRDPACPACGDHPTITEYIDYVEFCAAPRSVA